MKAVALVLVFAIGAFTGFFSRDYIDPCPGIENADTVRVWLPQDTIFIERDPVYIQTPAKIETLYIAEQQVKAVELDTTYGDGARVETQYLLPACEYVATKLLPGTGKNCHKKGNPDGDGDA
jgi:hypothetical protein